MKHEDVFDRLSPPPGGLADLRKRIEHRANIFPRLAQIALAATAVAVGVVLFHPARSSAPDLIARAHAHDDGAEMVLGLAPPQREPVELVAGGDRTSALERVPTARADIAFYWIESTREKP